MTSDQKSESRKRANKIHELLVDENKVSSNNIKENKYKDTIKNNFKISSNNINVNNCTDTIINNKNTNDEYTEELNSKKGKNIAPGRHEVYRKSIFGKTSKSHSFTSEASFEQILIFLFKSEYLSVEDEKNIGHSHPLYKHLHKMIHWSKNIDFESIKSHIPNYQDQKSIDPNRVKLFVAALLHYDMDIPTLIRYLGGNYTGDYRDTDYTIKILKESNCDPQIISDLEKILTLGCPMKMVASTTRQNFLEFLNYGNHTSIKQNLEKTLNTMSKEDRNQYLIPLPKWIARFS